MGQPATIDLAQLAELPALVKQLQDRIAELEKRQPPAGNNEPLLDAEQVAKLLGMTPRQVRQAAWRDSLPCVRVGRLLRFRASQLPR